jgi:hypothetical protein
MITLWKSTIFWDITLYSPLRVNRRFGWTYCFHLQGRISQARYQYESRLSTCQYILLQDWISLVRYSIKTGLPPAFMLVSCSAYSTLKMEAICPLKRRTTFNRPHSVISQKIILFLTTAVKTSNLIHDNSAVLCTACSMPDVLLCHNSSQHSLSPIILIK